MNEGPIQADYCWDAATFAKGMQHHLGLHFNPVWRWSLRLAGALWTVMGAAMLLTTGLSPPAVLFSSLALYFLVLRRPLRVFLARRTFRRRPDAGAQVAWTITDTGLRIERDSGNHAEMTWDAIIRALCTPDGVLLYALNNMFYYLPRAGIADEHDWARLQALVQERVRTVRTVS